MKKGIYMIAEVGQAHEGSFGMAHSYIDALAGSGINAVKFQLHVAEAESSIFEPFRSHFSYLPESRMEYWKRMEFTPDQWAELKKHCEQKQLEFIATPSCLAAVEILENLQVKKYKIGSGDTDNLLLLKKVAETGKEFILSSGMSSYAELDLAMAFLKSSKDKLSILHCTSAYPTLPHQWGLNAISELKHRYQVPIGFSDHSGGTAACTAAASLGAEILEFHVAFDRRMFGPDSKSAIEIDQVKALVDHVRMIETALQNPVDRNREEGFEELKPIFGKSLAVNKDLPAGYKLTEGDLETKKPKRKGIPASEFERILNRTLNKNMNKWDFITENDLC